MIERILALLNERGITAYKLTTDLGFNSGAVTDWKKGKGKPNADAIIKIANYFDVSTDYILLGGEIRRVQEHAHATISPSVQAQTEIVARYEAKFKPIIDAAIKIEEAEEKEEEFNQLLEKMKEFDEDLSNPIEIAYSPIVNVGTEKITTPKKRAAEILERQLTELGLDDERSLNKVLDFITNNAEMLKQVTDKE